MTIAIDKFPFAGLADLDLSDTALRLPADTTEKRGYVA